MRKEEIGKREDLELAEQADKAIAANLARERQFQRDLSVFVYIFGIIGPFLALAQTWKIFSLGTAAGTSLIYWIAYLIVAVMWFGYGLYYKNKAIMVVYGLWIIFDVVILSGIFYYS